MSEKEELPVKKELSANNSGDDSFLSALVGIVDNTKVTFGITLNVKGTVISGVLIPKQEYFDTFGALFASGLDKENPDTSLQSSFSNRAQVTTAETYIHLKGARFHQTFNSEPMPPSSQEGVLWRGRLSEIDGFILGEITPSH